MGCNLYLPIETIKILLESAPGSLLDELIEETVKSIKENSSGDRVIDIYHLETLLIRYEKLLGSTHPEDANLPKYRGMVVENSPITG